MDPAPDRPGETRLARWYGSYVALIALYWVAARLVGVVPRLGTSVTTFLGMRMALYLCLAWLMGRLVVVAVVRERTWVGVRRGLRRDILRPETAERLLGVPLFIMGTVVGFDVYGAVKQAIPHLGRYAWDAPLAELDRILHLGRDPWLLSHALPGGEVVLRFLDLVYVSWYGVLILGILVLATWSPLRLRARFFGAFVLLLGSAGSLAAVLFASGGPVYYHEFTGDVERFRPLLLLLEGTEARQGQRILWEAFASGSDKLYGGVSAMPSMHVGLTALLAIAAWRWHRVAGAIMTAYAVLVLVGSVHLGWHYAVDGYVAIPLALLAWLAWGRVMGGVAGGQ